MPRSKLVMKDVNRSDVPITFEFQMSIRGGRLKQATVIRTEGRSAASHLSRTERRGCARWCLVFVNGRRR